MSAALDDPMIEPALLGALMLDPTWVVRVASIVSENDFSREAHRRIYAAILTLQTPDLVTVCDALQRRGDLEAVGGASYVADILASIPAPALAERYAEIVAQRALLRRLADAGRRIAALPADHDDGDAALAAAAELLAHVRGGARSQAVLMADVIDERWAQHRHPAERTEGWPTGLGALDGQIGGLRDGELIVLGARPSMGKTALGLHLAVARAADADVLVVSLETGRAAVADRLIAATTGLSSRSLRGKRHDDAAMEAHEFEIGRLMSRRLYLLDQPGLTTERLAAEAWRLASAGHLGLVVVDYLTLLGDRKARGETDAAHVGAIASRLQRLAVELSCPVLLLAQLSREVERRDSHRPILSDLRDSGVIEQAASVVLLLYRPGYYGDPPPGLVEVIVAKQKDGPTGTVPLWFEAELGRFGPWTGADAAAAGRPAHAARQRPRARSLTGED